MDTSARWSLPVLSEDRVQPIWVKERVCTGTELSLVLACCSDEILKFQDAMTALCLFVEGTHSTALCLPGQDG